MVGNFNYHEPLGGPIGNHGDTGRANKGHRALSVDDRGDLSLFTVVRGDNTMSQYVRYFDSAHYIVYRIVTLIYDFKGNRHFILRNDI